jgi:hypothetical protein
VKLAMWHSPDIPASADLRMTQIRVAQGQTCDVLRHFVIDNLRIFGRPWHSTARSGVYHSHFYKYNAVWGHAVAQLFEALHYKPEGCGFDSR